MKVIFDTRSFELNNKVEVIPTAPRPLTSDNAESEVLALELAQAYLVNAELSRSVVKEFVNVDTEAWLQSSQGA